MPPSRRQRAQRGPMGPPLQPARVRVSSNEASRSTRDARRQHAIGGPVSRGLANMGFAAAYYIDNQQGPHRPLISYSQALPSSLNGTPKDFRVLLDYMALILARFKDKPGDHRGTKIRTTATRNVTATLLEENEQQRTCTIWIAKNGGPQNFNGIHDEDFVNALSNWFGPNTDISDEQMENYMIKFWAMRYNYHRDEIRSKFDNMKDIAWKHDKSDPRKVLVREYSHVMREDFDVGALDRNLQLVQAIANNDQVIPAFSDTPFGQPGCDQQYPRRPDSTEDGEWSPSEVVADCFRKLVKTTKRLYTIQMAMIAFQKFRQHLRRQNITLTIKFVERQPAYSISKSELKFGLIDLGTRLPPRDEAIPSAIQVHNDLTQLSNESNNSTPLYFHCELQLLSKFKDSPAAYKYIGCSKLSCFSCWYILSRPGANFTTKGSHGKLHWQCTFPTSNLNKFVSDLQTFLVAEVCDRASNDQQILGYHATSQSQTPPRVRMRHAARQDDIEMEIEGGNFFG